MTASCRVDVMTRTRFPADRGLASRMVVTMFLLGLLYVVFVAVIIAIGTSAIIALLLAGGLLVVQYFTSDRIALAAMGGKVVTAEQEPELHAVVDRLCAMAELDAARITRSYV
jgi:heat shock protein HtpX